VTSAAGGCDCATAPRASAPWHSGRRSRPPGTPARPGGARRTSFLIFARRSGIAPGPRRARWGPRRARRPRGARPRRSFVARFDQRFGAEVSPLPGRRTGRRLLTGPPAGRPTRWRRDNPAHLETPRWHARRWAHSTRRRSGARVGRFVGELLAVIGVILHVLALQFSGVAVWSERCRGLVPCTARLTSVPGPIGRRASSPRPGSAAASSPARARSGRRRERAKVVRDIRRGPLLFR